MLRRSAMQVNRTLISAVILFLGYSLSTMAKAQDFQTVINSTQPVSSIIPIDVGVSEANFALEIPSFDSAQIRLFVPFDGASTTLMLPNGTTTSPITDPNNWTITSGADAGDADLPGAVLEYAAGTMSAGTLQGTANFDVSTTPRPLYVRIMGRQKAELALILSEPSTLVGEDIIVSAIALYEGAPRPDATVTLSSKSLSLGTSIGTMEMVDNGVLPDLVDGDGVYAATITSSLPDEIGLEASVVFPNSPKNESLLQSDTVEFYSTEVITTATTSIWVEDVLESCITGLKRIYSFSGPNDTKVNYSEQLLLSEETVKEDSAFSTFNEGSASIEIEYRVSDLISAKNNFGEVRLTGGIFNLVTSNGILPQGSIPSESIKFPDEQFLCNGALTIGTPFNIREELRDGFVNNIVFDVPVSVELAGSYWVTTQLGNANDGSSVTFRNLDQAVEGEQILMGKVPAFLLNAADGRLPIERLVLEGPAFGANGAPQQAVEVFDVGFTNNLSRWQYYPNLEGDLNNDGSNKGGKDKKFIRRFLGSPALSPGDRRDLNRDGIIDRADTRIKF